MFPFSQDIEVHDDAGRSQGTLSARAVYEEIFPLLTPERQSKIQHVVQGRTFNVSVVLENIYDRGNASAVMRSAEALGLVQVHSIEPGTKFKESQRTTAGADKWVELQRWKDTSACVSELKRQGKQIIVTSLQPDSKPIQDVDFTKPSALVLGNEKDGASAEMIQSADVCVVLPMVGFTQSYNISVAGALCFYHIYADRMRRQAFHGDLTSEQKEILSAYYALRTIPSGMDILRRKLSVKALQGH
jgi:tRNA (guanosine-2'-O-)-methyltransferase